MNRYHIIIFVLACNLGLSQVTESVKDSISERTQAIEMALSPARAGFYSTILPGLGQAKNKQYWKLPIIYGTLTTSTLYYFYSKDKYDRYRTAFKLRKSGRVDEFSEEYGGDVILSDDSLVKAQKRYKKDKDLSLFISIGLYLMQILDASIGAHLSTFEIEENLLIEPKVGYNSDGYNFDMNDNNEYLGLSLVLKF